MAKEKCWGRCHVGGLYSWEFGKRSVRLKKNKPAVQSASPRTFPPPPLRRSAGGAWDAVWCFLFVLMFVCFLLWVGFIRKSRCETLGANVRCILDTKAELKQANKRGPQPKHEPLVVKEAIVEFVVRDDSIGAPGIVMSDSILLDPKFRLGVRPAIQCPLKA